MERGLHEAPLPAVILAFRHDQPVADQPLGPAEAEALLQVPGLADQSLPDSIRAVQHGHVKRPEPEADHIAVLPGSLQQGQRVAAELERVPEQPPTAGQHGGVTRGRSAYYSHLLPSGTTVPSVKAPAGRGAATSGPGRARPGAGRAP